MIRTLLTLTLGLLCISASCSQEVDIKEALSVYSTELIPYVKDIVSREYGLNEEKDFEITQVKRAREVALLIDTLEIKKFIFDLAKTSKEEMKDIDLLCTMIEEQYRSRYYLPPAFYEGARKKLLSK